MIIGEIASTEAKYVENLNTILSTFLPSLETVVSPRSLRQLVPAQLDQLLENHEELLGDLQDRLRVGSEDYDLVGDVFSKLCSHSNVCRGFSCSHLMKEGMGVEAVFQTICFVTGGVFQHVSCLHGRV